MKNVRTCWRSKIERIKAMLVAVLSLATIKKGEMSC